MGVFSEPLEVLHFAPERFMVTHLEQMPGRYVTADLRSPLAAVKTDMTDLVFGDQEFDVAIVSHVLEHIPDDRRALRELLRVLKPGGVAVLQHPIEHAFETTLEDPTITSPDDRRRFFGQADHVRVYGRDFQHRVTDAGFSVRRVRYTEDLDPELVARHALHDVGETFKGADIYVCARPQRSLTDRGFGKAATSNPS